MSSCSGGSGEIIAAVPMLAAGIAIGTVYGAGWLAYQGASVTYQAIHNVNEYVEETVQENKRKEQIRNEDAIKSSRNIMHLRDEFIEEMEKNRETFSQYKDMSYAVQQIERLINETKKMHVDERKSTIELETANRIYLMDLTKMMQIRDSLLIQSELKLKEIEAHHALLNRVEEMRILLNGAKVERNIAGDVSAISHEQLIRLQLLNKYKEAGYEARNIILKEQESAQQFTLPKKMKNRLRFLLNDAELLLDKLESTNITNEEFKAGIQKLEQCVEQYKVFELQKKRFVELYTVYVDVQKALELPIHSSGEFYGMEELEDCLEKAKKSIERTKKCAEIYKKLGNDKDAYMCLAFDTELRAMGYHVYNDKSSGLTRYTCKNGKKIPAYEIDEGDTLAMAYEIDEFCHLKFIAHADGSTSMQTYMKGNDENKAVQAQKKHCRNIPGLKERLRENWFIKCDIEERESPDVIKSSTEMYADIEKNVKRKSEKTKAKYQYL